MKRKNSYITATDQFCGAGGSSIGATKAGVEVRLAMNHWKLAIETHNTNFPHVDHVCTDISATDPRRYPSTNILITSPECTNHSLAKGKQRQMYEKDLFGNILIDPSEERSRATMWDVPRFAEYHDYEIIVVENVVEAGVWRLWDSWLHAMHALDYKHQVVYFNSMFAWPTPQSRDRMYTILWKKGNPAPDLNITPLAYCPRCGHDVEARQFWKKQHHWGRYNTQYFYVCPNHPPQNIRRGQSKKDWKAEWSITPYYYAAFNAIDFSIKAERIGERKDPLEPKTIERIKYGLEAYGRNPMIVTTRYSSGVECRARNATQEPIPTQPGDNSHAVVMPLMVETAYDGTERSFNSLSPIPTQTTRQSSAVVMPYLINLIRAEEGQRARSAADPCWTQTTCQDTGIVAPAFLAEFHGTSRASGIDEPLMCVTAGGVHHALLNTDAFLTYFYGTENHGHITDPIHTVTSKDRAGLVGALENMRLEDLTFRMLYPHEIKATMAIPKEYKILGNNKEQVKQCGNAVTPPAMEMFIDRCVASLA